MIKVVWEPNGLPSAADDLAELDGMRQKYQQERHIMGEEYYAACMNYVDKAETAARGRLELIPELEAMRQRAAEYARELGKTQPLAFQAVAQKLRDSGHAGWQADKLIQYASFIQARGWEAFYPEDAAFLKQKYAEAGVDAETIDFRS